MCSSCDACFTEEEKAKLKKLNWSEDQINFAEDSIVEDKIKELIN